MVQQHQSHSTILDKYDCYDNLTFFKRVIEFDKKGVSTDFAEGYVLGFMQVMKYCSNQLEKGEFKPKGGKV